MAATWTDAELTLELLSPARELRLEWRGASRSRDPSRFLAPILAGLADRAAAESRRLVLDFTQVDYMNSSTFAPLVKLLDRARRAGLEVAFEHAAAKRWQVASFAALKAFETPDGRIAIRAR